MAITIDEGVTSTISEGRRSGVMTTAGLWFYFIMVSPGAGRAAGT